jgi:hypothetical protein
MKKTLDIYKHSLGRLQDDLDEQVQLALFQASSFASEAMRALNKSENNMDETIKAVDRAIDALAEIHMAAGPSDEGDWAEDLGDEASEAYEKAKEIRDILDDVNGLFSHLLMKFKKMR